MKEEIREESATNEINPANERRRLIVPSRQMKRRINSDYEGSQGIESQRWRKLKECMHKEKLRFNKHQTDLWCKSKCDEQRVVPQN